jgi:hypothetical protein
MRQGLGRIVPALVGAALAGGVLVAVGVPASAQPAITFQGVDCGTTTTRWLFFPKGHAQLKSVNLPASPGPELQVFSGTGKKFDDSQRVVAVNSTQATNAPACQSASVTQAPGGSLTKQTTKAKQLVCTFAKSPVFFGAKATTGGFGFIAYIDGKPVASAQIADTGSTLHFDPSAGCKLKKLPK